MGKNTPQDAVARGRRMNGPRRPAPARPATDGGVIEGYDLSDRDDYLASLERMARLAFAQGRDTAAERYMVLLGKTYRHFVEPDQPEHDPAADLETVRQLVKRLVAAGELDLSDLTRPSHSRPTAERPPSPGGEPEQVRGRAGRAGARFHPAPPASGLPRGTGYRRA